MLPKFSRKRGEYKQGIYNPINPEKVIIAENKQNSGTIIYRSSWERIFMSWLDRTTSVIKWASEPFAIPYISPKDLKTHRYYVDFYFEGKALEGTIKYLVEVKPLAETKPPIPPKKKTEKSMFNYQKRIETYHVNQAKWESAKKFCSENSLIFKIITEEELIF